MSLTLDSLSRRSHVRLTRQHGLIGIDVGTRVIKMAQLEQCRFGWRLSGLRVLPLAGERELSGTSIEDGLIGESLTGFEESRRRFSGRSAACVLSSVISEPECQMLPQAEESELRSMVLTDEDRQGGESVIVDVWSDRDAWEDEAPLVRVSTYTLSESVSQRCAEDLLSRGLQCEYLDGLPFALSRAVQLVDHDWALQSVAVLDWGHSRPLLTILRDGLPAFTRVLRTCGTEHLEAAVRSALDVTPHEAARLLSLAPVSGNGADGRLAGELSRLARPQIERMAEQVRRTTSFLSHQYPELVPARLWIVGGGALMPGIDEFLSRSLGLESRVWKLPARQLAPSLMRLRQQPLFAAAVGLSVPV